MMLQVQQVDQVLNITLNRPDVRNAFHPDMIQQLTQAFKHINDDVRLVVLKGAGKSFCAGADLQWMKDMAKYTESQNQKDAGELFEMFWAIRNCVVPTLTVVHGAAFGGALGLIAASDIVLAESSTQFCFSEVKLGLAPAVISSFVLEKANVGLMSSYLLSGMVFGSDQAVRSGLVFASGDQIYLSDQETKIRQSFLNAGPVAVRATKKMLNDIKDQNWSQKKQTTTDVIAKLRVGAEGQEGLSSFFESRRASWNLGQV